MGWKQERDSLIAQTLAFVQSVTGKKDESSAPRVPAVDADAFKSRVERPAPPPIQPQAPDKPAVMAVAPVEPAKPMDSSTEAAQSDELPPSAPTRRPIVQSEMQEEIRARIASFRAHQERFNREREEYFSKTLARLRASMKDFPTSRLEK